MKTNTEQLWTIDQLAEYLQVKPSVIKYWVSNTEIPYIKLGKFYRFDQREIKEWVEEKKMRGLKLF